MDLNEFDEKKNSENENVWIMVRRDIR